jgi:hypothetical protein
MPGQTGKQRLAQSGRPKHPPQPHCDSGSGAAPSDDYGSAVAQGLSQAGFAVGGDEISTGTTDNGLSTFHVRTRGGCALPTTACVEQEAAAGHVPPGSVAGADYMVVGSVQQAGDQTRVLVRVVNVETGVVVAGGKGDAAGTGSDAIADAADEAAKALGGEYPLGGDSCGG